MANLTDLSLYIHIPFCVKRCRYCDFYSETGAGVELIDKTLNALLISLDASMSHLKPDNISTVFIGGGTPSIIAPASLNRFLKKMNSWIGNVSEFSVEVNPESLTRDFLEVLSGNNVNRISMGVQTYDADLLTWLGRPAGVEALDRADNMLEEYWQGRLSRDLLASLPGKPDRLLKDLNRALIGEPGHLSLYELTIEPGTPLAGNMEDLKRLPDEKSVLDEWSMALSFMAERGYTRYEISNFARKGNESQHNLTYWRMRPYLGIGPGAVSTIPQDDNRIIRRQEKRDLLSWLSDPTGSFSESTLTSGELALEHFMMGLRTSEGLSVNRFRAVFGMNPAEAVPDAVDRWVSSGTLISDSVSLRPTSDGMDLLDSVLSDIAAETDKTQWPEVCLWPQP